MKKLKVFFGDLIHNRHIYSYCVPMNIGYVTARINEQFGHMVETSLYKFPDDLISSLKTEPDILGLSNYDWNKNLNKSIIELARKANPNILIVMGGPNIRKSKEGIRQFLLDNPVDIYVVNDGEDGFCSLTRHILEKWPCNIRSCIFESGRLFSSVAYLENETRKLMIGLPCETSKEDQIPFPSPWLSGLMDPFLNSHSYPLMPLIETNRGCPHQCAYCTWGNFESKKIRKFDTDRVLEELKYVFKTAEHRFHLTMADANFGIFERDVLFAEEIRKLADKYHKLSGVDIFQTKNNVERNLEISKILGKYCIPDFAVQSFNEKALENVGRRNISLNNIQRYVEGINNLGLKVSTDLLIGLPGETKKSHIESVKKVFDNGFYTASVADIRLLAGSRMEEDDYRKQHGIKTKFRVIPSAYGKYGGIASIEYEECVRHTNDMEEKDFRDLRLFHAHLFLLYSIGIGRPLFEYAKRQGFNPIELVSSMTKNPLKREYPLLARQIRDYMAHAETEWFESEEAANSHYLAPEILEKILKNGFPKLNYEYAAGLILNMSLRKEFILWMASLIKKHLPDKERKVADELALVSLHLFDTPPFDSELPTFKISSRGCRELRQYIKNFDESHMKKENSRIHISFERHTKDKNTFLKRYGGERNVSMAVQTVLQINRRVFDLTPIASSI